MTQCTTHETAAKAIIKTDRGRVIALLVVAVAALSFTVFHAETRAKATGGQNTPFDLDPWLGASNCRAASAEQAAQLEQMAQARMQRAVFVPSEALRAASLLAEAALCAQQTHATSDAARLHQQWLRWKSDIASCFQGHRLRLDLALKSQRSADALTEIKALRTLLTGIATHAPADSALGKLWGGLDFEQRRIATKTKKK